MIVVVYRQERENMPIAVPLNFCNIIRLLEGTRYKKTSQTYYVRNQDQNLRI